MFVCQENNIVLSLDTCSHIYTRNTWIVRHDKFPQWK